MRKERKIRARFIWERVREVRVLLILCEKKRSAKVIVFVCGLMGVEEAKEEGEEEKKGKVPQFSG